MTTGSSDWPRKITAGADADGKPVEVLVVDDEVSRLLGEYWQPSSALTGHGKSPVMAALAELVWAGRQGGWPVEMFGDPDTGWALKLRSRRRDDEHTP